MKRAARKQRFSRRSIFVGIVVVALLAYGGSSALASLLSQNWYGPIRISPGFPSKPSAPVPSYPKYPTVSSAATAAPGTTYTCAYHTPSGTYRCRRTTTEANGTTKVDFGKSCAMWSECQGTQGGYETTTQGTAQCGSYGPSQCTIYCTEYPVGGRADDEGARVKRCLKACAGGGQVPCYAPGKRCSIASECFPDTPECRAGSSTCVADIGTVEPVSDYHLTGGSACKWDDQCRSGKCEPWWLFSPTQTDSQCSCIVDAHCATGQVCGVVGYRRACVPAPSSSAASARSSAGAKSSQGFASSNPVPPPPPPPTRSSQGFSFASSAASSNPPSPPPPPPPPSRSSQGVSTASSAASRPGMCSTSAECNGYFCIDGNCMTCVAAPNDGTDQRRTCPSTHYCAADGRCQQKKAAGSPCTNSSECLSFNCLGNYYGRSGICACSPTAPCPGGQSCLSGECRAASSAQSSLSSTESCTERAVRAYRETLEQAMRTYQDTMLRCLQQ